MDAVNLNRRAEQVSTIFNGLALVIAVLGGLMAVLLVVTGFTTGFGERVLWGLGVAAYTVLLWAAVQLSSLVAGYIHLRTTSDV